MWRIIFLGLLLYIIIVVLKRTLQQTNKADNIEDSSTKSDIEDMVQCAHCGVHLPRSEAFLVNGKVYCSKSHIQSS